MEHELVLQLKGIYKSFKGIHALDDVFFEVRKGEIHTLLGENGAGKSTILNIMAGSMKMDSGEIYHKGELVNVGSPLAAKNMGIVKVHQELQLIPELTVYENIFLGNEIITPITHTLDFGKMIKESNKILKRLDADFFSKVQVKTLSIAQQQIVEIAKALLMDLSVLILDEPTSSLTDKEIKKLFEIMRRMAEDGKAIIFVSHRLDEVFEISDRITVFRDGHFIKMLDAKNTTREELIRLMTGRDLSKITKKKKKKFTDEDTILSIRDFNGINNRFRDINFDLHKGEILGFAGLVGSGRTETMRAIFGIDKRKLGDVFINGEKVRISSTMDSLKQGIALIPEDRKLQGVITILPNMLNIGLSSFNKLTKGNLLTDRSLKSNAEKYIKILNIKPPDPKANTEVLSGGNQQKVVIAKWLSVNAKILIMDEPTRGIDVGAKDEIYKLMISLVEEGASIIMISSELPELLSMSDRIIVMREGKIVSEISGDEASETSVLHYAMGGK